MGEQVRKRVTFVFIRMPAPVPLGSVRTPWPRVLVASLAVLVAAACATACRSGREGAGHPAGRCPGGTLPPPPVIEPPQWVTPESWLTVSASVAVPRVQAEIGRQVPTELARGDEDLGFPGRVSYVVRRGAIDVDLQGENLLVETTVTATAQVCKPLGPICPVYGRCHPQFLATVEQPLLLDSGYSISEPKVAVSLIRGCTIVGFDASAELRRRAQAEAAGIRREIAQQIPALREQVELGWRALHQPLSLPTPAKGGEGLHDGQGAVDAGTYGAQAGTPEAWCLRLRPRSVAQLRPTLAEGVLSSGIGLSGTLEITDECAAPGEAGRGKLPPLQPVDALPAGVKLQAPLRLGWKEVSKRLTEALGGTEGSTRATMVVARGSVVEGQSRIAVALTLEGDRCGPVWLVAQPWFDPDRSAIRLRRVGAYPGAPRLKKRLEAELVKAVMERAVVSLPIDVDAAREALETVQAMGAVAGAGVADLRVRFDPPAVSMAIDPESLVAVVTLTGTLGVEAR